MRITKKNSQKNPITATQNLANQLRGMSQGLSNHWETHEYRLCRFYPKTNERIGKR